MGHDAYGQFTFIFSDGVLEIGDATSEMRLAWGEAPRALQRMRQSRARWREFWPDFRLLAPGHDSAVTNEGGEQKATAFAAFRAQIPNKYVEVVEGFQSHQWIFLKLLHESKVFRDLARSNRVLAYCLANNAQFRAKEDRVGAQLAAPHSHHKQREVLEWLGFPGKESVVRLLRRIEPEVASMATLRYLRGSLHRDPQVAQLLAHQRVLGCGVIALACSPTTTALASPKLLAEVAAREDEVRESPTSELLDHAMGLLREMKDTRTLSPFQSVTQVRVFHEDVAAEYETFVEQQAAARKRRYERKHLFPDPPVPGSDTIVPITTDIDLRKEGKEQCNCVSSYARRIRNGGYYVYRVLAPQRATLAIVPTSGGSWRVSELKLKANRSASSATRAHVNSWLYPHSLSA